MAYTQFRYEIPYPPIDSCKQCVKRFNCATFDSGGNVLTLSAKTQGKAEQQLQAVGLSSKEENLTSSIATGSPITVQCAVGNVFRLS